MNDVNKGQGVTIMATDQPTYPRLDCDTYEKVHVLATHLEIHSQFGAFALDTEQAQSAATALRKTAEIADLNAEAYNDAVEALEHVEHSLALANAAWDRLIGLGKTLGITLAIGAFVAVLNWIG